MRDIEDKIWCTWKTVVHYILDFFIFPSLFSLEQNVKTDQAWSNLREDREQTLTEWISKYILLNFQITGDWIFLVNIKEAISVHEVDYFMGFR